jgi:hypothetical protein
MVMLPFASMVISPGALFTAVDVLTADLVAVVMSRRGLTANAGPDTRATDATDSNKPRFRKELFTWASRLFCLQPTLRLAHQARVPGDNLDDARWLPRFLHPATAGTLTSFRSGT